MLGARRKHIRMRFRGSVLAASLVLMLVVAGCSSPAGGSGNSSSEDTSSSTTVVSYSIIGGNLGNLPLSVGIDQGFFKENGIRLKGITFANGPALVSALASGSVDVGIQLIPGIAVPIQKGQDLAFFCGATTRLGAKLVARPDSGIAKYGPSTSAEEVFQSLKGKSVGVPALGSSAALQFVAALKSAGLGRNDVSLIGVGIGTPAIAALKQGQVDALSSYPFMAPRLTASGAGQVVLNLDKHGGPAYEDSYGIGYAASQSWLNDNPGVAKSFCKGIKAASQFIRETSNAEVVKAQIRKGFSLENRDALSEALSFSRKAVSAALPRKKITRTLQTLTDLGILNQSPKIGYSKLVMQPW